jgi:hypothetical protein
MPPPTFDFKALAEYVAHLESKAAFVAEIVRDRDRLFKEREQVQQALNNATKRIAELELKAMGPLPDEDPIVLKAQIARLVTALERIRDYSDCYPEHVYTIIRAALNPEDT